MTREIPLYTLDGVADADVSTHPFTTRDGLGLSMLRFRRGEPGRDDPVVLLIPGLTASSDMFIMPEHHNLVSFLLEHGFGEVWTLDTRMSNRFPYNCWAHRFTLDDLALHDYPAALAALRRQIGDRPVHVIAHCVGALSFLMSLCAGTVTGIASMVANSVALTPRVRRWSRIKLAWAPFVAGRVLGLPGVNPRWAEDPPLTPGWVISRLTSLVHRECDVPACHLLSLIWGTGWPAMYGHRNLLPVTHARVGDLLQASGLRYYRHIRRMVRAGHAVRYDRADPRYAALPADYLAAAGSVTTPLLLITGDRNRIFTDSNEVCFRHLDRLAPGRHEYRALPGYGHIDPFIGRHAAVEVFPHLLDFLKRQAA